MGEVVICDKFVIGKPCSTTHLQRPNRFKTLKAATPAVSVHRTDVR